MRPGDVVLLHDPQTAGLIPGLAAHGIPVVWRVHVGATGPTPPSAPPGTSWSPSSGTPTCACSRGPPTPGTRSPRRGGRSSRRPSIR
ncbi:hypothetical protein [Baekduia soli]|uniref:hypothetical protein n=1 Tax=Baekduia soli TaxID=496014 RepID=UPI0038996D80